MKRIFVNWLLVLACVVLCAGCSALNSSQDQSAVGQSRPWTGESPKGPDYPGAENVVGLVNGSGRPK